MEYYIETLLNMAVACKTFKQRVIDAFYSDPKIRYAQGLFCHMPNYQDWFSPIKGVIEVIEIFGIDALEMSKKGLQSRVTTLEEPMYVYEQKRFLQSIDEVVSFFSRTNIKNEIESRLSILSSEEISRLNEALHCFLEDCNYSAVAMSVSAIEFRLLSLMTSINPNAKLEKMTLGQLINEYLDNKERYGNIIPQKYEPLLEHCNTYRIFSVHPKKEKINKSAATSIIHMTFQFLLDRELYRKRKR